MDPFLQNFQIFGCLPNGDIFSEKSLKKGTFLPKWPLKMGMDFMTRVAHLRPNQIWVPSSPLPGEPDYTPIWESSKNGYMYNKAANFVFGRAETSMYTVLFCGKICMQV